MQKLPLTLKPGKLKQILMLILNLGFVILGVNLLEKNLWIAILNIVLFGLGLIISVVSMLPNASMLYIDERGIEMTALFRKTFIPWQAVQNFSTRRVVFFKQVFFNLDESLINDKTKRKQGVFPDNYGMKAQELAELLNSYKNQILK